MYARVFTLNHSKLVKYVLTFLVANKLVYYLTFSLLWDIVYKAFCFQCRLPEAHLSRLSDQSATSCMHIDCTNDI